MMQSLLRFVSCKKIPPNLSWEVLFGDPYGNTRGLKLVHWTNFAGCGPFPGCGSLHFLRARNGA